MPPSHARSDLYYQNTVSTVKPHVAFVVMLLGALVAFEIFNYSTTDHALSDLLGDLTFFGIQWSTILALAFCGIDFAGIARLFTPEQGADEPKEVWYLFGAWLLAATMNAILTWWGVAMAVSSHTANSSAVIDPQTLNTIVPVFVAIMVWLIRILIIGSLSLAVDRIMHPGVEQRIPLQNAFASIQHHPLPSPTHQPVSIPSSLNSAVIPPRPASISRPAQTAAQRYGNRSAASSVPGEAAYVPEPQARAGRPEPTYHSLSMSARPSRPNHNGSSSENTVANRFRRS